MPQQPRELDQLWTAVSHAAENDRDMSKQIAALQTDVAIIKVRFALIGAIIGAGTSFLTSLGVILLAKALHLK